MDTNFLEFITYWVLGVIFWRVGSRTAEARRLGNAEVIEYGLPMRGLAIISLLFFAGLALASSQRARVSREEWQLVAAMSALGIGLALEAFGRRYLLTPEGLEQRSPWTRNFRLGWAQLRQVRMKHSEVELVFTDRTVRISPLLSGLGALAGAVERHAPAGVLTAEVEAVLRKRRERQV